MAVREGLLSLLQPGARYGYQLKTEFEAVTGGVWKLNVGQVYTTLDRLERDGLVNVDTSGDEGHKLYTLTAAGREELGAWWEAVPAEDPPPRDELMLKVMMAIEQGRDHALAVLTRQRTALFGLLQMHRRARPTDVIDAGSLATRLVVDAIVVRAEADLRWLDLCESRLNAHEQYAGHRSTGQQFGHEPGNNEPAGNNAPAGNNEPAGDTEPAEPTEPSEPAEPTSEETL